ncbi:hypothetical protein ABTE85_20260, partial [Acinetobacter baumannii]
MPRPSKTHGETGKPQIIQALSRSVKSLDTLPDLCTTQFPAGQWKRACLPDNPNPQPDFHSNNEKPLLRGLRLFGVPLPCHRIIRG